MVKSDSAHSGRGEDPDHTCALIADLATTNTRLAEYVLYLTATTTGQPAPVPPPSELDLAERLATGAAALCDRAQQRAAQNHRPDVSNSSNSSTPKDT